MSETHFHHKPDPGQAHRLTRFHPLGDPLADAAVTDLLAMPVAEREPFLRRVLDEGLPAVKDGPESWRLLLDQVSYVPFWVDWKTLNVGSRAFLRAGGLGLFSLVCYVTPLFYCLSNGNKALTFSGNLTNRAARRGRETARFVIETCLPNSLRRHGDGFKVTLRVRLMHAQIRKMIGGSGRWDFERSGVPINQVYMAAMMAMLSASWMDGLELLGLHFTDAESEGLMQLWRYSAYLMGVHEELLFTSRHEALRYLDLVMESEPPPDEDSRNLMMSLLHAIPDVIGLEGKSHARMFNICQGLSMSMMGPKLTGQLPLRKTAWRHVPIVLRGAIPVWEMAERIIPGMRKFTQFHGTRLWLQMAEFPPQGGLEMFAASREAVAD